MAARAVQFSQSVAVAHIFSSIFPLKIDWLCQRFSGNPTHEK
jgi:hypothetical protein